METYKIAAYTLIVILSTVELICWYKIYRILQRRSEKRTEDRRAFFRQKAYKDKAKARALKKARQTLWKDITNGQL